MYDFDIKLGATVMEVLGIDPGHLANARFYQQVKDIIDFYKPSKNPRGEMLGIMSRKNGKPLDILWTYVQLQKEKSKQLQKLTPDDFDKEIADELNQGYLTRKKQERIKASVEARKLAREKKKQQNQDRADKTKETNQKKTLAELIDDKLDVYGETIAAIENIDKQLDFY